MTTVAHTNHAAPKKAKFLHRSLWGAQALLAIAFVMAGSFKATTPIAELATKMAWVSAVPEGALAGAGLALVMLLASAFHLSRGEIAAVPINAVLGGVAAFIAWGRWKKAPITARRADPTRAAFTL